MKKFTVTILGSSAAIPTSSRNLSAQLLALGEKYFLIDCGEGTQMILRHLKIKINKIGHVFISHLHGDHFFGLIGLISTWHLIGRKTPLHVYGPPQLQEIIELQLNASLTVLSYPVVFHHTSIEGIQTIADAGNLIIKSFPLKHRVPTTGFIFEEKPLPRKIKRADSDRYGVPIYFMEKLRAGADFETADGEVIPNNLLTEDPPKPRSYAYCSDTAYYEPVAEHVKGVSVMYHEATFMNDKEVAASEKMHSTAAQAARIAKMAGAGKLIIGHFSARYDDVEALRNEAAVYFKNTVCAEDLETYIIEYQDPEEVCCP